MVNKTRHDPCAPTNEELLTEVGKVQVWIGYNTCDVSAPVLNILDRIIIEREHLCLRWELTFKTTSVSSKVFLS